MKTVVITGSTKGIGFGLADAFLARDCNVVVSGRKAEMVQQAVETLAKTHPPERIFGCPCEVTAYDQVVGLWNAAKAHFGAVDIWINNAGQANLLMDFWELPPEKMREVVETNIVGSMYGVKAAVIGMLAQGSGIVYNMEGFGSRGSRKQSGLTLYGSTKASIAFLTDSMAVELAGKPVKIGSILPGMVVTDMLLNQRSGDAADWERSKRAFNILADKVETIAPWIADQVLSGDQNGRHIRWLNGAKIMLRFMTASFTKRHVID